MELTIDQALQQAVAAHKAGDLREAERLYRAVLQVQPNHPDANHNLGVLEDAAGKSEASLPLLKSALESNPRQGQFWISYINALIRSNRSDTARSVLQQGKQIGLRGEVIDRLEKQLLPADQPPSGADPATADLACPLSLREAGQYAEAQDWLNRWLATHPGDAEAWSLLSQLCLLAKQDEKSQQALARAQSIAPDLPSVKRNQARSLLKQGKPAEALAAAQAGYNSSPSDPESLLVLAMTLGANQRDRDALPIVDGILAAHPDYAEALANRAMIRLRARDHASALNDAEQALAIKPHLTQLWGIVGSLRYQRKDLSGAIAALERAHQAEPGNAVHLINLGEFYRQNAQVDAALDVLEKAVQLAPGNANAWTNYGTALQEVRRTDAAKLAYEKALQITPASAEIASNLGALAKGEADWERALQYFDQALAIKPGHIEILANKAVALSALERHEEAEGVAQKCLNLDPAHFESNLALSSAMIGQKRYAEAKQVLDGLSANMDVRSIRFGDLAQNYGSLYARQENWEEAERWFRQGLAVKPEEAAILRQLAGVLDEQKKYGDAGTCLERARSIKGDDTDTLQASGNHFARQENWAEAECWIRQALAITPEEPAILRQLAGVLDEQQCYAEACASLERALSIKVDDVDTLQALGNHHARQKQWAEAEHWIRQALAVKPEQTGLLRRLAGVLDEQKRYEEARTCLDQALAINSDDADTLQASGNHYARQERWEEAEGWIRKALTVRPDKTGILRQLAGVLDERKKYEEARIYLDRALSIAGDDADILQALGSHHTRQEQWEEAERWMRKALAIRPERAAYYAELGFSLKNLCRLAEAESCYREAFARNPAALEYLYLAELILPKIISSASSISEWRTRYQAGIDKLDALEHRLDDPGEKVAAGTFDLAYHNQNDKDPMQSLCRLFRAKSPRLHFVSPHLASWRLAGDRRIRIGICSQFLTGHTIGKLYQGLIRHLDRSRFEVLVFHAPQAKNDNFRATLDQRVDKAVQLPFNTSMQLKLIADEQLDILFYPDIGMSPATYYLAYARLAPVQVVSWGHPDTTGIDTLDYFLSAALIEPDDAEQHYSERLILLNRLPCFYQPLVAPTRIPGRLAMGLPENGTLYGCPQSLFKFHPDFDAVLAEIAEGDPAGHIVLIEGKEPVWTETLKARWDRTCPILNERVIFLPRQPQDHFMALMAHFDVLLDPVHFGSGNTMYEAQVYGTPTVTWPGRFMRGRVVAGAYRQMGIEDAPIAERLEDFAPLALALGRDEDRRRKLRQDILRAAGDSLFSDMAAVRECEAFFIAAVEAAGAGEKLCAGWKPLPTRATAASAA